MRRIELLLLATIVVLPSLAFAQQEGLPESSILKAARAAAAASPSDVAAQAALGEALVEAAFLKEASQVFAKVRGLKGGRVAGAHGLAKIKMAEADYHGARAACQQVIAADRTSPVGHVCMGHAFLAWSRNSRAIESFQKALELRPGDADALAGLGDCHRDLGAHDDADSAYRGALKSDPSSARAHLGLGLLAMTRDRMQEAATELRSAIQADPGLAEAHYNLGVVLGDTAEGVAALRKAVEIRPEWPLGLEALGQALQRAGRNDEAVDVLNHAIKVQPNLGGAFESLGAALAHLKRWPEAEAALHKAIEIVPNMPRAMMLLGEVQAEQGLHDEALETLRRAADLAPRDAEVPLKTARIFRMLARNTQAIAQLRRASELDPALAAPEVELGDIYFDRESWQEARQHYEAAMARANKAGVDVARVRSRLEQLRRR